MGRVTRKQAAEIAEKLHVDEDAVLDMDMENAAMKAKLATPEPTDRSPLGELEPNSAESKPSELEAVEELKNSTRGRKAGKKGAAKGKKTNLAASTATLPEDSEIVADDNESAPSPASEKAAKELVNEQTEDEVKLQQDRSQSPPRAAMRLTRSQLSKSTRDDSEAKSLVEGIGETPQEQEEGYFASNDNAHAIETSEPTEMAETMTPPAMDAPTSPLPTAVPKVIESLRTETPTKRSTSNKENVQPQSEGSNMASPLAQSGTYDALEEAVVAGATPPPPESHASPRSRGSASPRPEDSIAALDELEEAVENVSKDIPEVHATPAKPKRQSVDTMPAEPAQQPEPVAVEEKSAEAKKASKKAAPVVRTTKASQARISMAQNKDAASSKPPGLGRPRPSVGLGRSTSVRESVGPKPDGATKRVASNPTTAARARPTSLKASTTADGEKRGRKDAIIPHSKPRPISLSFPTPPPPPKSTKATTQSTFQLPGEAVAAKLKAAREARMAKEAEEAEKKDKKPAFKARPAPKTNADVPSVRPTNASRARESIMSGKPAPAASHKRSNTVADADRPRVVSKEAKPATTAAAEPRPSTSLANITKPRASIAPGTSKPAAASTTARVPSNGTSKGKEVFARAANAKAAAEKEKAEKEAAAKKARAEAAERSRLASREWAEKQRLKKLGVKPEGAKKAASLGEAKPAAVEKKQMDDAPESGEATVATAAQPEEVEATAA